MSLQHMLFKPLAKIDGAPNGYYQSDEEHENGHDSKNCQGCASGKIVLFPNTAPVVHANEFEEEVGHSGKVDNLGVIRSGNGQYVGLMSLTNVTTMPSIFSCLTVQAANTSNPMITGRAATVSHSS